MGTVRKDRKMQTEGINGDFHQLTTATCKETPESYLENNTEGAQQVNIENLKELQAMWVNIEGKWPMVYIMTIKGNLRHRILKLGEELDSSLMNSKQMELRAIAEKQGFQHRIGNHPARPEWAGGAFLYCEPVRAEALKKTLPLIPIKLQSKHVVCSPQYLRTVFHCLNGEIIDPTIQDNFQGREKSLIKRAGQVKELYVVQMPSCSKIGRELDDVKRSEVDDDLVLFMAAPVWVQEQAIGDWEQIWKLQDQNLCEVCDAEIDLWHVCFSRCRSQIKATARTGSFLRAIMTHTELNPPTFYAVKELDDFGKDMEFLEVS